MAEYDQSIVEHEVEHDEEQVQEHENLEQNPNLEHDLNLEHNLNVEHNVNLEQNLNLEHNVNLEQNLNLEENLEENLGEQNLNLEENLEENLGEQNLQQESQHEPKEGHEDEAVVGGSEKRWPGWPGESVFRMLVPAQKVGSIIGRKGEFIKKIVEETRARIKILDGPPGTTERAVMVSATDVPDSSLPPAMDGLLRVHKRIVDGLDGDSSHAPAAVGTKVSTRLLVPASQAGSLIGKQGTTVKSIQESSSCIVRVLGAENLPVFALQDDRVVELVGEAAGVHKAVELVASHLRKFLVDRSIVPLFEMHVGLLFILLTSQLIKPLLWNCCEIVLHISTRCGCLIIRWSTCHLINLGVHLKVFLQMLVWVLVLVPILSICHHHGNLTITTLQLICLLWTNNRIRVFLPMEEKLQWVPMRHQIPRLHNQ
ncbi:hypothetical protein DITRI_Ditri06bG0148600 [Diplodiscus trichospermus]